MPIDQEEKRGPSPLMLKELEMILGRLLDEMTGMLIIPNTTEEHPQVPKRKRVAKILGLLQSYGPKQMLK
jgi:hypothetical protein